MRFWDRPRARVIFLLLMLAAAPLWAGTSKQLPDYVELPDENLYLQGRFVYQRNCEICHGYRGDGRGTMGLNITPKPRNFSLGIFKYRSTPAEFLPTSNDLMRTVKQGLAGSSMPTFQAILPERDIRAAVEYIKTFSTRWNNPKNYAPAVIIPAAPDWFDDEAKTSEHAAKGKLLYDATCIVCHGPKGIGDGPSAAALVDSWGQSTKPADLSQPFPRSGPGRIDIYRTLVTGIAGTPMPSFKESTTEEQRWELIAYLETLRHPTPPAASP